VTRSPGSGPADLFHLEGDYAWRSTPAGAALAPRISFRGAPKRDNGRASSEPPLRRASEPEAIAVSASFRDQLSDLQSGSRPAIPLEMRPHGRGGKWVATRSRTARRARSASAWHEASTFSTAPAPRILVNVTKSTKR